MELTGGGFEPPRTVLNLTFDAPDLAGLDVRMYVPPLGELQHITGLAGSLAGVMESGEATAEQGAQALGIYDTLAKYMKSWNVTRGGVPVPPTAEGIATQEVPFLNRIFRAWLTSAGDVPAPLAPSSPPTLPDLSMIPMQTVPASLPS